MTQFENSEIMQEYAKLILPPQQIKIAWDWTDMANAIGLEALTFGGPAAAGAMGLGGAAGIAGGIAASGGLLGLVLGVGGLAYAIYEVTKITDDNIDDLKERAEALDSEGTHAQGPVKQIIDKLEGFKSFFEVQIAPPQDNPGALQQQANAQLANLTEVSVYLKQIAATWPQIKPLLKDWGRDPEQFETALNKTTVSIEQQLAAIKSKAQQAAQQIIKEKGQKSGLGEKYYLEMAKEVISLRDRIVQLTGAPPVYDTKEEQMGVGLAELILSNEATSEQIDASGGLMKNIKDEMERNLPRAEKYYAQLQKKKTTNKASIIPRAISKRSMRLSFDAPGDDRGERPAVSQRVKNPLVAAMQKIINHLNTYGRTGADRIKEDGIYGEKTSDAFKGLLYKNKALEAELRKSVGISGDDLSNMEIMNNPEYLSPIYKVLYSLLQRSTGMNGEDERSQEQRPGGTSYEGVYCDMYKEDPSPEEMSACMRSIMLRDPQLGQEQSIYMFLQNKGLSEGAMRDFIYRKFRARKAADWDTAEIMDEWKKGRYGL